MFGLALLIFVSIVGAEFPEPFRNASLDPISRLVDDIPRGEYFFHPGCAGSNCEPWKGVSPLITSVDKAVEAIKIDYSFGYYRMRSGEIKPANLLAIDSLLRFHEDSIVELRWRRKAFGNISCARFLGLTVANILVSASAAPLFEHKERGALIVFSVMELIEIPFVFWPKNERMLILK